MKTKIIIGFLTIISIQLSAIKDSDLEILKNTEILAINQDPIYGISISPFRWGVNVSYRLLYLSFSSYMNPHSSFNE